MSKITSKLVALILLACFMPQASWASLLRTSAPDSRQPKVLPSDIVNYAMIPSKFEGKRGMELAENSASAVLELSSGAREAAELLGVLPQVERLLALKGQDQHRAGLILSDEAVGLEVYLLERITEAALEVRTVAGRIDRQLAFSYDVRAVLEQKRDRKLNLTYIANFTQSGVLGITAGPFFIMDELVPANLLLMCLGAATIGLSSLALLESRGGKRKIDSKDPNILGHFLDLSPPRDDRVTEYVWKYVNSVPPGSTTGVTRREALINEWKKLRQLDLQKRRKLHLLAGLPQGKAKKAKFIDIKDLTDRIFFLHDVHYLVEQLDQELLELLQAMNDR